LKRGQTTEALKWLRKAVVELGIEDIDWDDKDLDPVRDTPEFQQLQKEYMEGGQNEDGNDLADASQGTKPEDECKPCTQ